MFSVVVFLGSIAAQEHHGHSHSRNEVGISGGAVYSFDHSQWGPGVHVHYYRTLGEHSRWSVGGMVEYVSVHGDHMAVGAGVKYQLTEKLSFGVLPGATFLRHEEHEHHGDHSHVHKDRETLFSVHVELVYDLFHWDKFHLGPVIDYSYARKDSHGMIGVHGAFCF